jgi:hypothetical protein
MKIWNFTMVPVLAHATLPELSDILVSLNEGPSKSVGLLYTQRKDVSVVTGNFPLFRHFPLFPISPFP